VAPVVAVSPVIPVGPVGPMPVAPKGPTGPEGPWTAQGGGFVVHASDVLGEYD
jgi:hypothetical protein